MGEYGIFNRSVYEGPGNGDRSLVMRRETVADSALPDCLKRRPVEFLHGRSIDEFHLRNRYKMERDVVVYISRELIDDVLSADGHSDLRAGISLEGSGMPISDSSKSRHVPVPLSHSGSTRISLLERYRVPLPYPNLSSIPRRYNFPSPCRPSLSSSPSISETPYPDQSRNAAIESKRRRSRALRQPTHTRSWIELCGTLSGV